VQDEQPRVAVSGASPADPIPFRVPEEFVEQALERRREPFLIARRADDVQRVRPGEEPPRRYLARPAGGVEDPVVVERVEHRGDGGPRRLGVFPVPVLHVGVQPVPGPPCVPAGRRAQPLQVPLRVGFHLLGGRVVGDGPLPVEDLADGLSRVEGGEEPGRGPRVAVLRPPDHLHHAEAGDRRRMQQRREQLLGGDLPVQVTATAAGRRGQPGQPAGRFRESGVSMSGFN
jgi:hypothetical protein